MTYICIPNYSVTEEVAQLAVEAIKSFKKSPCVVVVADDQSPLNTDKIREIADVFIPREKNGGFSAACNTAFKYALSQPDCEYIVCANTDIEAPENWVEEFEKLYTIGADMCGGLGYKEKGTKNERSNANYVSVGGRLDDWMFPGGFWGMKREVLETVGLLDENFKHGGMEDIDFFYRAKKSGKRLMMTPKVWYWHQEGATRYSKEERGKQSVAFLENVEFFKEKHGFDGLGELNTILTDERINF